MKIVIAMMKHETNTFSPVKTDWKRFENWGAYFGEKALSVYENTGMPMAAYIDLARDRGAEIVTPVAAEAMPSGPVATDAYSIMSDAICEEIDRGCDLVLLDLHGAMVAESTMDGEGTLLERIRNISPDLPIGVTCDFHCNLTPKMVDNCTALIGYKTYPHVDMYRVGKQLGQIVLDAYDGKCKPIMSHQHPPMLTHTLKQGTDDQPTKSIIRTCLDAEKVEGVLAATFFGGFSLADTPNTGASTLVVTDADKNLAENTSRKIADLAWQQRDEFVYHCGDLGASIKQAGALTDYPVILLDHEDNCGSGGTQDVMAVIKAISQQGLKDVAVAAVYDPEAVKEMQKQGVGSNIMVSLGGKIDMPSVRLRGKSLLLEGRVRALTDGHWTVYGPMYTGVEVDMGPTALFETNGIKIIVVSRHHEPWDIGVFTSVGIQPQHEKFLLLKSRIHYRAGFGDLARNTLLCDGEGVTTSRYDLLTYKNLKRPVFPLDEGVEF
jgi:microcystin degradation protein MlrC